MKEVKKKIILVGFPNSGKTTLFNWLTGYKNRVINYPGSTVSLSIGSIQKKYNTEASVIDTPGVYSLFPQSEDEAITYKSLFNDKNVACVVLVMDVSKIEKQSPLLCQLKESGFKVIVALTMSDLVEKGSIEKKNLENVFKVPFIPITGLIGEGVSALIEKIKEHLKYDPSEKVRLQKWTTEKRESTMETNKPLFASFQKLKKPSFFLSQKWDSFLLHPKWGLVFFFCIMFSLFSSLFWLADPFMSIIDNFFSFSIRAVQSISSTSLWVDFLSNGILGSFGSVLIFVPQIFILFFGISFLEDTGYLSRAISLIDGLFSRVGLSGRSFIPFLSGYACAIPAVLSTRNISSTREKWMTLFAIPLMSCSARLPVYALLLSFLFYGESAFKLGLVLTLIYFGSFLLGILAVSFLNLFLKKEKETIFAIDLPLYRRPVFSKLLNTSWIRTKHYITKAGFPIFIFSLIVWVSLHFPRNLNLSDTEQIQQSYASIIGQFIEPIFKWIGVDWRVGVGLLAAFVAREVFVSSLVLIFSITVGAGSVTHSLLQKMNEAVHSNGEPLFTTGSVTALIVLFMLSLQCLSTTAVIYKETNSKKFALIQFISLNVIAYIVAILTYQAFNFFSA